MLHPFMTLSFKTIAFMCRLLPRKKLIMLYLENMLGATVYLFVKVESCLMLGATITILYIMKRRNHGTFNQTFNFL